MDRGQIMVELANASPNVLAKVAAVLTGKTEMDADLRTITLVDAAKRLNVSRPTIYRMIQRGAIETVLLNGVSRVRLSSLINYATSQQAVCKTA